MRRLYLIILYLGSFICSILLACPSAFGQCTITNLNPSYCSDAPSFTLTGGSTYTGNGVTGSTFDPAAAGPGTHQIVSTTGTASSYTVSTTGTFAPVAGAGTTLTLANEDDAAAAIGFTFNFYSTNFNNVRIGSNGLIGLGIINSVTSGANQVLPNGGAPNNIIAVAWDDLDPTLGGTISYFTTGTAPFRKFIVNYNNIQRAGGTGSVTAQLQLHETTNYIEIHTTSLNLSANFATQGVENSTGGTAVVVPGRNNAGWTATNEYRAFIPNCVDVRTVTIGPDHTMTVAPANTMVCTGSMVNVTISNTQTNTYYRLQNNATNAALSGYFQGTGGDLTIASFALTANTTIEVYAINPTTTCDIDLNNKVVVTVNQPPTTANAGPDLHRCFGPSSFPMNANAPAVGTGAWTIIGLANGATITDPASNTTTVTGLNSGASVVLRWTISNPGCTSSYDDLTLTYGVPPPPANAGPSVVQCNDPVFYMAANNPPAGTGVWSQTSGPAVTIEDPADRNTAITGVPAGGGNVVLRWSISTNNCALVSSDTVTIRNDAKPTTSNAGPDQDLCGITSTPLAANTPGVGTGAWTIVSGAGGSFVNAASPTTTFNGVAGTAYVLRWTISNASCAPSTDDVTIKFDVNPTVATAGTDQQVCGNSVILAANAAGTGSGVWSIISGAGGSFVDATDEATTFNGVPGTTYVLGWTISSPLGVCAPSSDDVQIILDRAPTTANAGPDQNLCSVTTTTLAGNTPVAGTGQWSFVSGAGGSFADATDESTTFNGVAGTTYVLGWTISNGVCTDSYDEVTIKFDISPTVATAGPDQTICGNSAVLAGNNAVSGNGTWTIISGAGGSFVDASDEATTFNGVAGNTYDIRWTINSDLGACAGTFDEVQIKFDRTPTIANAGPDQTNLCGLTSTTLAGNAAITGTGTWTIVSGAGGSIVDINDETTTFNGVAGNTYVLGWTISNGVCADSYDEVTIRFDQLPSAADAGTDINQCNAGTFTMAATNPAIGTGTWTLQSGTAAITNPASYNTTVTGVPVGTSATLRWTVGNGSCAVNTDDVTITNYALPTPTLSSNDADNIICSGTNVIFTAGGGSNYQFFVNGSSVQNGASTTYSTSSLLNGQVVTVQVTSAAGCSALSSGITTTVNPLPVVNLVSNDADNTICAGTSVTFTATPSGASNYTFRVDGATVQNSASNTYTTSALGDGNVVNVIVTTAAGCSATSSDITMDVDVAPNAASAGADIIQCNTSTFTMNGNVPVGGTTGTWTVVTGTATITSPNVRNTTVTGVAAGSEVLLRWTISNGVCASTADEVLIRNDAAPSAAVAGADIAQCNNGTFTLNATAPVVGTGVWSLASGTATITNANSFNTSVTGVPLGTSATLRWTVTNGSCAAVFDDVIISNNSIPTPTLSSNDADNIICSGTNVIFTAGGGSNYQFFVNGSSVQNGVSTTYSTSSLLNGQVVTVQVTSAAGCSALSSGITTTVNPLPVVNLVSNDADNTICAGTSVTFTATPSGSANYNFRVNGASVQSSASRTFTTTTLTDGSVVDVIVTSAAGCSGTSAGITMDVDVAPNAAAAGADIVQCNNGTFTMNANAPVSGTTGTWSVVTGAATITSPNSPTTTVTGVVAGSGNVVLRWTISNGVCAATTDQLFVRNDAAPTVSNAGGDQVVCGTSTNLGANLPATGTGIWSIVSNPDGLGVISDANSRSSLFTGTPGQTYELRWSISNGSCAPSTDEVQITFETSPIAANAGPDQDLCGVTSAVLAGNSPATGSGLWTIVSGVGGSFIDPTDRNTIFNGTAGSAYVLRWTLNNGVCADSFDDITIRFDQSPSASAAGSDQIICGTAAVLAANIPGVGTGMWSVVSGAGGSFVNATDATTTFNGTVNTTYVLRWTIGTAFGICASTLDDVQIRFDQTPTIAQAGPDQNNCGTTAVLAGNTALIGSGAWSIISGAGGSFADATDENTIFSGVSGTTYVLRWTITGVCASTSDDVQVALNSSPTVSLAGADENVCATSVSLDGNTPVTGGGLWTVVSGVGGSFVNNTDPNTIFNGASGTTYVLRWTISNGACAPSVDEVQIRLDQTPTPATAGVDQNVCGTSTTLAGNAPLVGTGSWSVVSGAGGSFTDNTDPTTIFNGLGGMSYVLRWTITNGLCSTNDEVTINYNVIPTTASAGPDQDLCGLGDFTLNANTPGIGLGSWSIIGPSNGATITTPASATSTVTGLGAGSSVTLRWTITNGSCTSADELVLTNSIAPPAALAGADETLCNAATFTMAANSSAPGTGLWTVDAGTATITNTASPTTTVTGIPAGTSATLRWTITNGSCSSADVVILTNSLPPVSANAGTDQEFCSAVSFALAADTPSPGTATGLWTIVGPANGAVVTDDTSPTSTVTGLAAGASVTLRWTVTNGVCTSADDVVLINNATPVATAGADIEQCANATFILGATNPALGTGQWSVISGPGTIANINSYNTTITGVTAGSSTTLRWTVTNGSCVVSDDVVLTNRNSPVPTLTSDFTTICAGETVTFTAGGGTNYEFLINGSTAQNGADNTYDTNALTHGQIVSVRVTDGFGCTATSAGITMTVNPLPVVNLVGSDTDNSICAGSSVTFTATPSGASSYDFRINGLSAQLSGVNTFTTSALADNNIVTVVVSTAAGCDATSAGITMNVDPVPTTADAGLDQLTLCGVTSTTLTGNSPVTGTGQWTVVSGVGGSFADAIDAGTVFNGAAGATYVLRWTITTSGVCAVSSDDVTIRFDQTPVATAGADIEQCANATFTLGATNPALGTGQWSVISGPGTIANINSYNTTITGVTAGSSTTLRWTVTNGSCVVSDDVVLTNRNSPVPTFTSDFTTICAGETVTFTAGGGTNYEFLINGSTAQNGADNTYDTSALTHGQIVSVRVTDGFGCTATSAGITMTVNPLPVVNLVSSDADNSICAGSSVTFTATPSGASSYDFRINGLSAQLSGVNTFTTSALADNNIVTVVVSTAAGCDATSAGITMNVDPVPTTADAGLDQLSLCGLTSTTLGGNTPLTGTGQWTVVSGVGGSFADATDAGTVFNGAAGATYVLRWTITTSGVCAVSSDDVTIRFDQTPVATAGADIEQCANATFILGATNPALGTGQWSVISGPGTIANINSYNTTITGVTAGSSTTLRWTVTNGSCVVSDDVVLTNRNSPVPTLTSDFTTICAGETVTFTAGGGTNYEFLINGSTAQNGADNTYDTNALTHGQIVSVRVTDGFGCTATSAGITMTVNPLPVVNLVSSDADNSICAGSSVTFTATPSGASSYDFRINGLSMQLSGVNTFTTSALADNNIVTVVVSTAAGCDATSAGITMNVDTAPNAAVAGGDIIQCDDDSFVMSANTAVAGTIGTWSIVSGTATIANFNSPATAVTGVVAGSGDVILRWTISNGVCVSTSDDILLRNEPLPTVANAGADQLVCGTSVTLGANLPGTGSGSWSITVDPDGLGLVSDPGSRTSLFTGTPGETYVLRWTISNGTCTPSTDDVQISFEETATAADAGTDQALCNVTSAVLAGNIPLTGTGLWTIVSGAGGSFVDNTDRNTAFNGVAGTSYVLRWTLSNGVCTDSNDDVAIRFDQAPSAAIAGGDIEQCSNGTFMINATNPAIGTGVWSVVSGTVSITNINSFATTATGIPAGTSATLRWTVSNGTCASVSDEITLTNSPLPTIANAGPDQELCSSGNFTMNANAPVTGSGLWTVIGSANGATITTPASAVTTVTGLTIGSSVTLRWTISSGSCESFDEVALTNSDTPTVALAGADQEQCNNGTFTLAGNTAGVGSGAWTIQGAANGAVITNVTSPTTTVTNLTPGTNVTLRWTITNGSCISFDDVVLINNASPTVAIAGADQNVCGSSTVLNANIPGVGTGSWSVISGAGGSIVTPSDPASDFNGVAGTTYVLRWTVTNGICSSFDDVQIALKRVPDIDASSATICSGNTTNIAITNPNGVPGTTFSWIVQSASNVSGGAAGNSNLINQTLNVTDGVTQGTIIYRITPTANGCSGAAVDVTVTVNPTPVITTAASDLIETICSEDQLNFTPASNVVGTGYSWTSTVSGTLTGVTASGTGAIADTPLNSTNTTATITYVITPSVAGCSGAAVNYVVTVRPKPDVMASDQGICSGQSTSIVITNPNGVSGTTFSWIVLGNTNVNGAAAGSGNNINQVLNSADAVNTGTVVYRITPSSGGCPGDALDVTVTVTPVPVITNSASDFSRQICSNETLNFLPSSTITGTTYSWTSTISGPVSAASVTAAGTGTIADTPVNTGNVDGTVTYRITPAFNGCNGTPVDLVVTVKPLPSASGADFTICSGQTAFLTIAPSPKNVTGTTFSWTALPSANITGATNGNGSTINQLLTTTNASIGTVTYTITPVANGCAGPVTNILATVNPIATVNARTDFQVCEPATFTVTGDIGGSATVGTWSVISGVGSISASSTTVVSGNRIVTATYTVGAGDIAGSVVLRLITNDPDAAGPCSIVTDDLTVTVNQRPRVTVPADFVVCEPTSIPLTGNLDPSATAGSWSVLSGAGTLSVSSITGDVVTAAYTPGPADIGNTVSFRLTTNDPDGFGPCTPATDDISITINPASRVNAGVDFATCEDQPIQLAGTTSGATSSTTWSGGGGASRFSNVNNPAAVYSLTPADISAGAVTLTLTGNDPDGAGPCTTVSDQVTIQVNRLPNLVLIGLGPSYAENSDMVTLSGFPGPGTFTGPGILAGTGQFYPSNAGSGSKTITYTHTDAAGCTNTVSAATIVNPVTDIEFYIEDPSDVDSQGRLVICENSGTNDLLRLIGQPEWNHPTAVSASFRSPDPTLQPRIVFDGINGYRLNTRNLPGGTYLIEYIFTNTALATDTLTKVLIVNSAPKAVIDVRNSCIEDVITYADNSHIALNNSGGTINRWSWTYGEGGNGNDGVSQNPTYKYSSEGFKTLGLRVTTDQGCQHDTTKVIRVSNPPKPDFTWSKICVETETTEFKDLSDPGIGNIIQYAWDFNDGDTLGLGVPSKAVPANTHGGKTSNTYKDPHHRYADFQVYNVKLTIRTDDGCQNAITKRIYILDYGKPTQTNGYREDFENGKGTWVETSSHNDLNKTGEYSWVFGTPSGDAINSAYSGVNAWWTGGNANSATDFSTYYQNDSTEVTGPCLDLTGIERPMISLNYWSHSQENFDGAVVQYSTNGGATWKTVGDAEKRGINWYNSKNIPGAPGGQDNFAWSGKTYGWKNARFNLDEIPVSDRDLVVFRIAFGSNSDNLPDSVLNGFAFDDVYIGEKKRTVLVEHFTNANTGNNARVYLDNLFTNQTLLGVKTKPDFIKLQYHLANGGFDQVNDDNPTDPATRAFIYGVDTPPTTVMDGILGPSPYSTSNSTVLEFNGDHALIDEIELDRRALDDPKFLIQDTLYATQSPTGPLVGEVTFTYVDSMTNLTTPVILHTALVEANISGNRNVLRKLLWQSGGRTENRTWVYGDNLTVPIDYTIDVPITDPDNLYLVTFVQDKSSRYILQSSIIKAPAKTGLTPVGIEDNPFDAEIRNIHVYPNPASKQINFALENPLTGNYTYRIIDQRGITILDGELNRDLSTPQEVELTTLSNGIYFVQFRTQDKVVLYKKIAVMNRH